MFRLAEGVLAKRRVRKLFVDYSSAAMAEKADPDIARALLHMGILRILAARSVIPNAEQAARIGGTTNVATLERWLAAATSADSVTTMLSAR